MKLGWIGNVKENKMHPHRLGGFSTSPQGMYTRLYPDEDSAVIRMDEPDYDLLASMDAVLYMSGSQGDSSMLKIIDKIPCKVLTYHEGGEHDFLRWKLDAVLANHEVIAKSDLILVWDTRTLGLHKLYTSTPFLWWPLPYPAEQIDEILAKETDVPEYDIVVAYGPSRSQGNTRNGIAGCILAQYLLDNIPFYKNAGTFSCAREERERLKDVEFLKELECSDVYPIPFVPATKFLAILSKAKLVINLDQRRASGRVSLECAYVRTPVIATYQQPFVFQVYNGIRIHDMFDIDSMIDTATLVAEGRWHDAWFDLAYERAQHFSYANKARVLEEAVARL